MKQNLSKIRWDLQVVKLKHIYSCVEASYVASPLLTFYVGVKRL